MSLPWFKFNTRDFLDGVAMLPVEERGAYITVLALIYQHGGKVADEPRYLAGMCLLSVRGWNKVRAALIVKGKLFVSDGYLMNQRACAELRTAPKTEDNPDIIPAKLGDNSENADLKSNENSELPATEERGKKGEKKDDLKVIVAAGDRLPVREAFDLWNELARCRGLPVAIDLTETRRKQIKARLGQHGLGGWREALAAVEASPMCLGENERGWRANLDFVCQPKSFAKLREGAYAPKVAPTGQGPPIDHAAVQARLAADIEARRALAAE